MEVMFFEKAAEPVELDQVVRRMKDFPFEEEDTEMLSSMVKEAAEIANPKAAVVKAEIQELGEKHIVAGGVKFTSALLRKNVSKCSYILAYTASCSRELLEWSEKYQDDMLATYAADIIMELYLGKIIALMHSGVKEKYFTDRDISSMAPGSLIEWPLTQQKPMFALLDEQARRVGVELTDSCLMVPAKSVSGIYFSADQHFESCSLCTMENCPNRRAEYTGKSAAAQ